jgi:hypothetical protein
MDVKKILEELRFERDLIEDAILNLERLRASGTKRRGRPPKWLQEARTRQASQVTGKVSASEPSSSEKKRKAG